MLKLIAIALCVQFALGGGLHHPKQSRPLKTAGFPGSQNYPPFSFPRRERPFLICVEIVIATGPARTIDSIADVQMIMGSEERGEYAYRVVTGNTRSRSNSQAQKMLGELVCWEWLGEDPDQGDYCVHSRCVPGSDNATDFRMIARTVNGRELNFGHKYNPSHNIKCKEDGYSKGRGFTYRCEDKRICDSMTAVYNMKFL